MPSDFKSDRRKRTTTRRDAVVALSSCLAAGAWTAIVYGVAYNDGANRDPNGTWWIVGWFTFMGLVWFVRFLWLAASQVAADEEQADA